MKDTIALVGAPGSGKSTVGRMLAQRLGLPFTDVDRAIEDQEGQPVSDIFVTRGEEYFRQVERSLTLAALAEGGVVALGGGAPVNADIATALGGVQTVWLDVSARTASARVGLNDATRPLLLGNVHSQLVRLMAQRRPIYQACSRVGIVTDDLSVDQVVDQLIEQLDLTEQAEGAGS